MVMIDCMPLVSALVVSLISYGLVCHWARTLPESQGTSIIAVSSMASFIVMVLLGYELSKRHNAESQQRLSTWRAARVLSPGSASVNDVVRTNSAPALIAKLSEELLQSRERERLIADFSSDVHFCLSPDLKVLSINPTVKRHWAHEPAIIIGQSLDKFVLPSELEKVRSTLQPLLNQWQPGTFETRVVCGTGAILDTEWSVECSRTEGVLFCIVQDITERKAAERLKKSLFAMIGHDLRVPLASAQTALALVRKDTETNPRAQEVLNRVDMAISRVIGLSSDMLDLQQCEEGKITVKDQIVSLPEVLSEVVEEFKDAAESRGQKILLSVPPALVSGDEDRIKQIVANFLSNATKYADSGATIAIGAALKAGAVEVTVEDSGPGIAASDLPLLFQPYSRLSQNAPDVGGSGLGLSLCRYLAVAQQGAVGVRASELGGACFWLRLGLAEDADLI